MIQGFYFTCVISLTRSYLPALFTRTIDSFAGHEKQEKKYSFYVSMLSTLYNIVSH